MTILPDWMIMIAAWMLVIVAGLGTCLLFSWAMATLAEQAMRHFAFWDHFVMFVWSRVNRPKDEE